MDYTFEVPINDFANSWYLDINDPKSNYVVQLGRKFKNVENVKNVNHNVLRFENINLQNDFIYITDSNKLEAPNDHILFEKLFRKVTYRNVKTGQEYSKDIKYILEGLGNTYGEFDLRNLYKELYQDEFDSRMNDAIKNPGSNSFGLANLTKSGGLPTSGLF